MCSTDTPYIVNDDPGDDSTYLDRPSTAPNADRIEALENREAMARDALNHLNDVVMVQGSDLKALFERGTNLLRSIDYTDERVDELSSRIDQITDRLVKLAVAQAHLRAHLESPKLGLLDRIRVRLGRPIFSGD